MIHIISEVSVNHLLLAYGVPSILQTVKEQTLEMDHWIVKNIIIVLFFT